MNNSLSAFTLIGFAWVLNACGTPNRSSDEDAEQAAISQPFADAATDEERADAVEIWASQAPVLAILDVESAVVTEDGLNLTTEAVLHVVEILRDEQGLEMSAGDRLWMEIPGGQIGERSQLTSSAPLLFEGDTVLARLTLDERGDLGFDGHNSVIPVRDGLARVCVNPDPGAILRCVDAGSAVIALEELPLFTGADAGLDLPVTALRGRLL